MLWCKSEEHVVQHTTRSYGETVVSQAKGLKHTESIGGNTITRLAQYLQQNIPLVLSNGHVRLALAFLGAKVSLDMQLTLGQVEPYQRTSKRRHMQ